MMTKIVDKVTKDLDLRAYHDGYKERIEALIASKMKGEVAKEACRQEHDESTPNVYKLAVFFINRQDSTSFMYPVSYI